MFCYFFGLAKYSEVSASTLQLDEDPLLATVGLLEANWISVQEIFELVTACLRGFLSSYGPSERPMYRT
jgi:hypothetical protein